MSNKILIIGAGEIGTALAEVLKNKAVVDLWDYDLSRVPDQKPLEQTVPAADYIFLCVPSQAMRPVVLNIKKMLNKKTGLVCLSKGVELKTKKIMPEVLKEILPVGQPFAMLGGPMLAGELKTKKPGVAVLASKNLKVFINLQKIFSDSIVRLEITTDIVGTAWSGVLKNVYAMALGMADGLGWGANAQAWLLSECLTEMEKITVIMGGKTETVCYTAGLSDLVATGFSSLSKNRSTGEMIAKTNQYYIVGEGIVSFPAIWKRLGSKNKIFPILIMLEKILIKHQNAAKLFEKYFRQT